MKPSLSALALFAIASATLHAQSYKPPEAFPVAKEVMAEIGQKTKRLDEMLRILRKQGVPDVLLVDVEVYHRAATLIVEHNEFFQKDSASWTLAVLDRGMLRANLLAGGDKPWLGDRLDLVAGGLTVARAYRSRIDGSIQPFAVTYPVGFGKDPKKKWRIDVELHGRDNGLTEVKFLHAHRGDKAPDADHEFVKISIYGRGNNAYRWAGETDVFEAISRFLASAQAAGQAPLLDPSKIVLRGFSMGGAGTWHLGLHFPDRWAAIGPGAGFTTTHGYVAKLPNKLPDYQEACLHIYDAVDYATNAFNVPVVAYSGAEDPQKKAADNIEAILKKAGINMVHLIAPDLKHTFPAEWFKKANEQYTKFADRQRSEYPELINFTTYTMKYPGCNWAEILGMDRHYEKAQVLAAHAEAGYVLKTQNIQSLRLTMADFTGSVVDILIDDQKLKAKPVQAPTGVFNVFLQRRGKAWTPVLSQRLLVQQNQRPRKIQGLQGPIDDAFTDSFLCVRGTGKPWHEAPQKLADARLERFGQEWSKYWRGSLPVKDDTDVTNEDIATRHLVLFGDPSSNSLIGQVLDGLPLEWTKDNVVLAGQKSGADRHLPVMIYPNPLNPARYVVLNSGHTIPTGDYEKTNALFFPRLGDYAVLRAAAGDEPLPADVVTAGLFNDEWAMERK